MKCMRCGHSNDQHNKNYINTVSIHFCYGCREKLRPKRNKRVNKWTTNDGES
jgi:hypothetical protein